ncbi:MAG: tRNA (N6-threonylcarbamoyladenosine(37)-N6)-methyltransferase TrmO [Butyrivibrio sp.]
MKIIGYIKTDFPDKFGIPRQSGLVPELKGEIIFNKEYAVSEAVRGLEEYSHIWILWQFSKNIKEKYSPTVRPPRLGGNKRMGVFATRSPFRPNPIGLSVVKLEYIELRDDAGPVLHVSGADLMDNTPIYDIKPYLPHIDAIHDARGGFSGQFKDYSLEVDFPGELLKTVPAEKQSALLKVLANDPRPSYQNDTERVYGMFFAGMNIKFSVADGKIFVKSIEKL